VETITSKAYRGDGRAPCDGPRGRLCVFLKKRTYLSPVFAGDPPPPLSFPSSYFLFFFDSHQGPPKGGPWYATPPPPPIKSLYSPKGEERDLKGPPSTSPLSFLTKSKGTDRLPEELAKRRPNGSAIFPLLTKERYPPRRVDVYFNPF
jgi:hypothetical protein